MPGIAGWAIAILAILVALYLWARLASAKYERAMASGSYGRGFVYVEEDGGFRDLTQDEVDYLNTPFEGGDGGRPYIKSNYRKLTPDGRISGFLERRKLPSRLARKHH